MMRAITRGRIVVPIGVLLLSLSAAAYGHSRPHVQRFAGVYVLESPPQADKQIKEGIKRVTDKMGYFIRGFARDKMRERVKADPRIQIESLPGDRLRLTFGQWRPPPVVLGGDPVRFVGSDGKPGTVSTQLEHDHLIITSRVEEGVERSSLALSPDQRQLTMSVRITAPRLPVPLTYQLRYRRVS